MRVYATPAQYAEWLGLDAPPAGATQALRAASIRVAELLMTACYSVDDEGYPSDVDQRQACADAVCAVAASARIDGDTSGDGVSPYQTVSVGSASLSRGTRQGGTTPSATVPGLDRAYAILQLAGLLPGGVWVR